MSPTLRCLAVSLALSMALASPLASPTAAEVPDWIASTRTEEEGRPVWVSAEEAAPNGFLRWDLFDGAQQDQYRRLLEQSRKARAEDPETHSEARCIGYLMSTGSLGEAWSPEEILERAGVVYSATIEDAKPGFLNGNLGTLVHASVREVLKAPTEGPVFDELLVFIRTAAIEVEGEWLCARDNREPASPRIGGLLILVLAKPDPDWRPQDIFVAHDPEVFFETDDRKMSAPYPYGKVEMLPGSLEEELLAARGRRGGP